MSWTDWNQLWKSSTSMGKDGHNHSIWNRISLQQAKAITSRSSKIRRGNQNCRKRWPEPHQWIWTAPWRAAGSDECDLKKKPGNTGKPTSKRRKKLRSSTPRVVRRPITKNRPAGDPITTRYEAEITWFHWVSYHEGSGRVLFLSVLLLPNFASAVFKKSRRMKMNSIGFVFKIPCISRKHFRGEPLVEINVKINKKRKPHTFLFQK